MKLLGAVLIFVSFEGLVFGLKCKDDKPKEVYGECRKYKCGTSVHMCPGKTIFDEGECVVFDKFSADQIDCFNQVYGDNTGLYPMKLSGHGDKYFYCNSLSTPSCSVTTCDEYSNNKLDLECYCLNSTYPKTGFQAKGKKEQDVVDCRYTDGFLQAKKAENCGKGEIFSNKFRKCQEICYGNEPDPKSCKSYFECDNGIINKKEPQVCKDGELFSAKDKKCMKMGEAECFAPKCEFEAYEFIPHECSSKKYRFCSVQDCPYGNNWDDKNKTCV